MLEKIKAWLIHKLGGYTYKYTIEPKVIHSTYPIKLCKTIITYRDDYPLTEIELAHQAAIQIADAIIRDRLYEYEEETDMLREGMHVRHYTVYIAAKH